MVFKRKKKKEEAAGEEKEEKAEGGEEKEAKEEKPEGGGEGEAKEGEGGEAAAAEGGEGDAKAKKKKKLIIIAAGVVMLLVLGGAGVIFSGLLGGGEESGEAEKAAEESEVPGAPVFFDLPPLLVNLNTGSKSTSFMKATITLELADEKQVDTVKANLPRLMDNYNTFLREMKASDLYGSAGTYRLREEMLLRANKMLAPVKVKDVLFRELLVQ